MGAWMAVRVGQLAGQRLIAFDGKTVRGARTADAMHCQRETARHITGKGAHYMLTLTANQPTLRAACKAFPGARCPRSPTSTPATAGGSTGPSRPSRPRTRSTSRPDPAAPPNANHQGPQDNRGRLRDLLAGHDRRSTGHRRHLDPGPCPIGGRTPRPRPGFPHGRLGRSPGSVSRSEMLVCSMNRTSGWTTFMPNAVVATLILNPVRVASYTMPGPSIDHAVLT